MIKKVITWYKRPHKSTIEQYIEAFIIIVPLAFFIRTFFYGLYKVPTGSMETTMLVGEYFLADKFTVWFTPIKRGDIIAFNDPNYSYSDNKIINIWQRYVWGPSNWTKRVIGLPGERVKGVIEDGHPVIYINDIKLDEPYINKYPIIALWAVKPMLDNLENARFDTYKSYDPALPFDQQNFYRIDKDMIIDIPGFENVLSPGTPKSDGGDVFEVTLGDHEYWAMGDNRLGSFDSRGWGALDGSQIHGKIIFRLFSLDSYQSWWIVDLLQHPLDFFKRIRFSRCLQRV
ncbi:MAG: signal peptidase I [Candidatus Babeliaceae bacterium]